MFFQFFPTGMANLILLLLKKLYMGSFVNWTHMRKLHRKFTVDGFWKSDFAFFWRKKKTTQTVFFLKNMFFLKKVALYWCNVFFLFFVWKNIKYIILSLPFVFVFLYINTRIVYIYIYVCALLFLKVQWKGFLFFWRQIKTMERLPFSTSRIGYLQLGVLI